MRDEEQEHTSQWTMAHAITVGEFLAFFAYFLWVVAG